MLQIIKDPWPRREHFRHYMDNVRCTYSLTVQVEVTGLRQTLKVEGLKAYPAQIYLLATTVNRFPEMRMGLSEAGEPGYWEISHPSYTIFHPESKTFSSIWTAYRAGFRAFYSDCLRDMHRYAGSPAFAPQADRPPGSFDISSVPWVDFTAFNLNVYTEGTHLAPIFTLGKYVERDGRTWLPLAMQLHHAACDGYHAGQFVEAVEALAGDFRSWL